ncbi:MAG: EamA family transporter [Bacteroidetes bacterium]|nr:EamA family transporter [Bacteroidota bacterium]
MKSTFTKLHVAILFAALGSILGGVITMNEGLIVWWRMIFASIIFLVYLLSNKKMQIISLSSFMKVGSVGGLLGLHWVFFFGSIKAANISIGVVCFALVGFFTAILEPILLKRKFSYRELIYSFIVVVGIVLIFSFDIRYRTGIVLGLISSTLYSLMTIFTKKVSKNFKAETMLFYQMIGGVLVLSVCLPFYLNIFPVETIFPDMKNGIFILILALFSTVLLQLFNIQVLQKISAFTVNLSYNLDAVYSIIIAISFFNEARELNTSFYVGISLITLSVLLQAIDTLNRLRWAKKC